MSEIADTRTPVRKLFNIDTYAFKNDNSCLINIKLRNQGFHKTYRVTWSGATHVYDN